MGNKPQCGDHCCSEEKREEKNGPKEWDRHRHNPTHADVVTGGPQGRALVKMSQGLSAGEGIEEKQEEKQDSRQDPQAPRQVHGVSPADVARLVPEVVGTDPQTAPTPVASPASEVAPAESAEAWRSMTKSDVFQVPVQEGNGLIGMKAVKLGNSLVVKEVDAYGLLSAKVRAGDIVVDVNGETRNIAEMLDMLNASHRPQPLKISLVRILEVFVEVEKTAKLGIGLAVDKTTDTLFIMAFADSGLVIDYNAKAEAGQQIFSGDEVVEVNGKGGGGEELMQRMGATETTLQLLIRRKMS